MPLIGAVADDLTGATTTGVLLARSKARTAVYFNEEAAQRAEGTDELDAILKELIETGRGIEVNTSRMKRLGLTNPKEEIIRRYKELGGEIITFGSDAHTPDCLGSCFKETGEMVKSCGLDYFAVYRKRKPSFYPI